MRKMLVFVVMLTAVAAALPAVASDELAQAGQYSVWCEGYEIRLAAGDGVSITRDRDGRVTVDGARGEQAAASCTGGCIVASPGASCTIERPAPTPASPAFTVSCPEGDSFEIDRGGSGGNCSSQVDSSNRVTGGSCDDGQGNSAEVDCSANDGEGRCAGESGSMSCTQTRGS